MENEPRIFTDRETIYHGANLTITFKCEQYKGQAILDTKVEIDGGNLCWITWSDKEKFTAELKAVIDKYSI